MRGLPGARGPCGRAPEQAPKIHLSTPQYNRPYYFVSLNSPKEFRRLKVIHPNH